MTITHRNWKIFRHEKKEVILRAFLTEKLSYSSLGMIDNAKLYNADMDLISNKSYTYDDDFRLIKEQIELPTAFNSNSASAQNFSSSRTYNDLGFVTSENIQGFTGSDYNSNNTGGNTDITYNYTYNYFTGELLSATSNMSDPSSPGGALGYIPERTNTMTNSIKYFYDTLGNIETISSSNMNESYSYYNANNKFLLDSINGLDNSTDSFSYNKTGDITSSTAGKDLTYSPLNKVASVTDNGNETKYGYGMKNEVLTKSTLLDGKQTSVIHLGGYIINTATNDVLIPVPGGAYIEHDGKFTLVQNIKDLSNNVIYKLHADPGSNNLVFDQAFLYSPYGIVSNQTAAYNQAWKAAGGSVTDIPQLSEFNLSLGYNGLPTDPVTADQYLGENRLYSPNMRRFLQPDPARAELNYYAYAGNNPIMMSDPSGLIKTYKDGNGVHSEQKESNCSSSWYSFLCGIGSAYSASSGSTTLPPTSDQADSMMKNFSDSNPEEMLADTAVEIFGGSAMSPPVALALNGVMNHYAFGDSWSNAYLHTGENEIVFGEGIQAGVDFANSEYIAGTNATIAEVMILSASTIEAGVVFKSEDMIAREELARIEVESGPESAEANEFRAKREKTLLDNEKHWYKNYSLRDHLRGITKETLYYNWGTNKFSTDLKEDNWGDYFKRLATLYAINIAASGLEGVDFVESSAVRRLIQKSYDYPIYQLPVLIYHGPTQYGYAIAQGFLLSYGSNIARWRLGNLYDPKPPMYLFSLKLGVKLGVYTDGVAQSYVYPYSSPENY